MGKLERISGDVPSYMADGLKDAVRSGDYASENEALRDALAHWLMARNMEPITPEGLEKMLQASWDSGPGRTVDEVCDRLEAKYLAMADAPERKG